MVDESSGWVEQGRDLRPIPDPTVLTTELTKREISALREVITLLVDGHVNTIIARLDGMDKLMEKFEENLDHRRDEVDAKITALRLDSAERIRHEKELEEEKFRSIAEAFKLRDVSVEKTAIATKVAVDAALQAAEKAVEKQNEAFSIATEKSENATTKNIDALGALLQSMASGLNDKIAAANDSSRTGIDDLKNRIGTIETRIVAMEGRGAGGSAFFGYLVGGVGVIGGLVAIFFALSKGGGP